MSKETYYFSHDYDTRSDIKIKKLISKHGYEGYGLFWAIVEDLYMNANALPTDYEAIAYDLRSNPDVIKSIVENFGLFIIEDNTFGSLSIQERLDKRVQKSQKARESAHARWNKEKGNANAIRTQCDSNAIKERKVKKSKENDKNNISWKKDFEIYKQELRDAYLEIINDKNWMQERETYYPKADIKLSIDKALKDFWATEAGWENKKRKKTKDINWKNTFNNILANKTNIVWKK